MSSSGSNFVVQEEDTFSMSSLSENHSEEDRYDGYSYESCSDYEAEERWQAEGRKEYNQILIKKFNIQIPDKQQWIASWLETGYYANSSANTLKSSPLLSFPTKDGVASPASYTYKVNLYGYYKKKQKVGGYGVIFRDPSGKPVSASVWSSIEGSYLYYLLKGLKRGLTLALAYGLDGVLVLCNSERLVRIFDKMSHTSSYCYCHHRYKYRSSRNKRKICKECAKKEVFYDVKTSDEVRILLRIIKDVNKMRKGFKLNELKSDFSFEIMNTGSHKTGNEAAYYLAKYFKNKREMKPKEFPHALREIIWKDAYEGDMSYSKSSWLKHFHEDRERKGLEA